MLEEDVVWVFMVGKISIIITVMIENDVDGYAYINR